MTNQKHPRRRPRWRLEHALYRDKTSPYDRSSGLASLLSDEEYEAFLAGLDEDEDDDLTEAEVSDDASE